MNERDIKTGDAIIVRVSAWVEPRSCRVLSVGCSGFTGDVEGRPWPTSFSYAEVEFFRPIAIAVGEGE